MWQTLANKTVRKKWGSSQVSIVKNHHSHHLHKVAIVRKDDLKSKLSLLSKRVHDHIRRSVLEYAPGLKGWFFALLLGDKQQISEKEKRWFKILGIYHLVVISGLHLNYFSQLTKHVLITPIKTMYVFRLLNPQQFIITETMFRTLIVAIATIYAVSVGIQQPVQRSLIILTINLLSPIFIGSIRAADRIFMGLSLQFCLFPVYFFSAANLLSWYAYSILVINEVETTSQKKKFDCCRFFNTIHNQVLLALFVGSIFGQISIVGIALNLLLSPFSMPLLASAFFVGIPQIPQTFIRITSEIHHTFLNFCQIAADFTDNNPILFIDIRDLLLIRYSLAIYCLVILLKKISTTSIRD